MVETQAIFEKAKRGEKPLFLYIFINFVLKITKMYFCF